MAALVRLSLGAAVVAGLSAGLTVALMPSDAKSKAPGRTTARDVPGAAAAPVAKRMPAPRIAALPAPTISTAAPVDDAQAVVNPEEQLSAHELHRIKLDAHLRDGRDPEWAAKTEHTLSEEIRPLQAANKFTLVNMECRTTSCVGTVEWPDRVTAQHTWRSLIHHYYSDRCGTFIALPEASDESARFQAKLHFDCTEARAERVANGL